jgi:two-component system nitrate/nitrite response regulator NarL
MDGCTQVALVDDHPLARRGLAEILAESGDIEVLASVANASELEAVAQSRGAWPQVVVLDLYLGVDEPCLDTVAQVSTHTRVLVVSASARPADVVGAVAAGAMGYVTKSAEPGLLVGSVRAVGHGGFALSAELADILHSAGDSRGATGRAPAAAWPKHAVEVALSPREEETLDLIARGFTHAQTATRMGVSISTVDTYIERVRAKLQVGNKAELTRAALNRKRTEAPQ